MGKQKKLNDQQFRVLTIKVDKVREVLKIPHGKEYKDKLYLVDVLDGMLGTAFSVKATGHYKQDLKRVFREIKKILYL